MDRLSRGYQILFLTVAVLFSLSAFAELQVITGTDNLAARHRQFPASKALSVFSGVQSRATGFLWGTFGSDSDYLTGFLQNCPVRMPPVNPTCLIRIHFLNGPCRRWRRCKEGELALHLSIDQFDAAIARRSPSLMRRIQRRARAITALISKHDRQAVFLVSTGLEDNYNLKTYRVILNELRSILPPGTLVGRNPENSHSRRILTGDFIELHGVLNSKTFSGVKTGALRIFSNDGQDLYFGSGRTPYRRVSVSDMYRSIRRNRDDVDVVLYWKAEWQGITGPQFVKPFDRTPRVNPADITVLNHLIRRNENAD